MNNILKYQNPNSPLLIQRINQSDANFVKRLLDPNRKSIPDWETKGQKIATHKMSWGEDDRGAYVFPEVQEIDGQLIDFSRPPYAPGIADYMAHKNNNIIRMSPEEADWFTRNYKQYYPSFKKGGHIHIKKKNRGKFTAAAKRAGMGVQEFARHVLANKDKYSSTLVKRANFARNSKKFKHENGGILKAQEGTGNLLTPHPLSPVEIALNQAKIMAKMKGEQQYLPPGVKEVVGPDGKKVAIRTEQPLVPLEQSIAEWMPGIGDVAEVGYIGNDLKNGNLGSALLGATLIAIPGNAGKIKRSLPELSFRRTPTYGQMKVRDLANYAKNSGLDKLSDESFLSLRQLIQDAQNGTVHGSNYQRIARMIDDDLRKFEKPKGKPLNRWQQPFDEMIPMENFGHRRKTTDNFRLSDYYKNGGKL